MNDERSRRDGTDRDAPQGGTHGESGRDTEDQITLTDEEVERVRGTMVERADIEAPTPPVEEDRAPALHARLASDWAELRGPLRERWPELPESELDAVAGEYDRLVGKLAERLHVERAEASRRLDAWLAEREASGA